MQISTHSQNPSNLQLALRALRGAVSDWSQADQHQSQAEFPARRASFDDEPTDSSWHGRQLGRHFRTGGRNVDDSQRSLQFSQSKLRGVSSASDSGEGYLTQLAAEYQQAGDEASLLKVRRAKSILLKSEQAFQRTDSGWGSADSDLRFTDSGIRRADLDINRISFDRPGTNVSHYGHRVSNAIRSIQNDLRQADFDLQRASRAGDQGESGLHKAIAVLESL